MSVGIVSPNVAGPKRVIDLIQKAYRIAHVLGIGEPLTLVRAADGFDSLNDIIEQAMLEKTFAPYQTELVVPLIGNQLAYTIGPSTVSPPPHVVAVRPVEVLSAFARRDGHDLPVFVTHAKRDYDGVSNKSVLTAGWSTLVYYQASFPAGTLYVYPQPADASTTLYLTVLATIAPFSYLEEEVSVPPGYWQYLKYALAKRVCADHGMIFGPENEAIYERCEAALERNNIKPLPVAHTGLSAFSRQSSGYDIRTDSARGF